MLAFLTHPPELIPDPCAGMILSCSGGTCQLFFVISERRWASRALRGLGAQRRELSPARHPLLLPADAGSLFGNGGPIPVLGTVRFDGANGAPCKVCMCSHDDGLSSFIQVSIPFLCESFLRRFSESNQCFSPIY